MIRIDISGARAYVRFCDTLTVGMVGATAEFHFDDAWNGLYKTAVFRQGDVTRDVTGIDSEVTIPHEVFAVPGIPVYIGVYGTNADGTVVIPTVWVKTANVKPGADPSGDESTEPSLPVWAQLGAEISALKETVPTKITAPDTASVGQMIIVKAVDENGKPTEWEAVDRTHWAEGGGITDTARALLISILRNAVYTSDQSASITALNTELAKNASSDSGDDSGSSGDSGETQTVTYTVVNSLTNVENSNTAASVVEGSTYVATLAGVGDYSISSVTISMGGADITASAWDESTGTVTIAAVSGDIIITATAKVVQTETLEMVYTTSYPDITTFEYTEQTTAGIYVVAKESTIAGGVLSVDFDPTEATNFGLNLFIFDADGNPYKHTCNATENSAVSGEWEPLYADLGTGAGFCAILEPFTVAIPEGCTVMANMRKTAGVGAATGTYGSTNAEFAAWAHDGGITFTVTG